jgi:phosphonate transport system substrate-binding protein
MQTIKSLWILLVALSSFSITAQTITFGIVPQQPAKKLAELWTPALQYIRIHTGLELHFATAKNIPQFEKRLLAGEYDIAYMNPYHYTVFSQKTGYQAVAKELNKKIRGIIVVRRDSSLNQLSDLEGETIAFPSPATFAASIIPQTALKKAGIHFTPQYVSSHDSVYLNVQRNFFHAGGGVIRTLNMTDPFIRKGLRILWTAPKYTSHAIAAHPRMDKDTRDKIVAAMIAMNNDPSAKDILKNLNMKGFEAAQDNQWNDVRDLNIHLLDYMLH